MSADQRHCARFLVTSEQNHTLLEIDGTRLTVRLVDVSAEGFCVETRGEPNVDVGSEILILSTAGWHQARVVRCQPIETGLRLGLFRLGDIVEIRTGRHIARDKRKIRADRRGSPALLIALGFCLLIGGLCYTLLHADWGDVVAYLKQERLAEKQAPRGSR